jgi:hypothetical protein
MYRSLEFGPVRNLELFAVSRWYKDYFDTRKSQILP